MRPVYAIFLRAGGWVSVLFVWLGFILLASGISAQIGAAKLADAWETSTATILKKSAYEGGGGIRRDSFVESTKFYIDYVIETKDGPLRNAYAVPRSYYISINEGDVVPARYFAPSPDINELYEGQAAKAGMGNTAVGVAFSVLGLLIALGFGFTARKGAQLLRQGETVQATVLQVQGLAMFSRIRYGFKAPNGVVYARKSFWRLKRAHKGILRRALIEVKYDSKQPGYSFWLGDLTGRK